MKTINDFAKKGYRQRKKLILQKYKGLAKAPLYVLFSALPSYKRKGLENSMAIRNRATAYLLGWSNHMKFGGN